MDAFNLLLEMKLKRRRERPNLPRTVTELVAEDGSRVYVVGTAHFSDDSKRDVVKVRPQGRQTCRPFPCWASCAELCVQRPSQGRGRCGAGASGAGLWVGLAPEPACPRQTIREVQPDVVVVELCQYRVSMLKMDERTLLREAKEISLEKLQQAVRQVRRSGGLGPGLCPRGRRIAGWPPAPRRELLRPRETPGRWQVIWVGRGLQCVLDPEAETPPLRVPSQGHSTKGGVGRGLVSGAEGRGQGAPWGRGSAAA